MIIFNYFKQLNNAAYHNDPLGKHDRRVGIEIELEELKCNPKEKLDYWKVDVDGSLRGMYSAEFISNILSIKDVLKALSNLKRYAINYEASFRTSVHVHVDISDFGLLQLKSLLLVYSLVENILYELGGGFRTDSNYCNPLNQGMSYFRKHRDGEINYYESDDHIAVYLIRKWNKYSALNLRRVEDLGTAEFRMMEGNLNVDRLNNWCHILVRLIEYSKIIPLKIGRAHV